MKDHRQSLAASLCAAPVETLADAVYKLNVFIEMNEPLDNWRKHLNPGLRRFADPSWPELSALLADLSRIAGLKPDAGR